MSDEEVLARVGLESIAAEELCPEIHRDGSRLWFTVVRKGERVRLFEISLRRALVLLKQLADATWALADRVK